MTMTVTMVSRTNATRLNTKCVWSNWYRLDGTPATMPAKMMIEIPLPMPCSVISSPSQIANIVPAVIVTMTESVVSRSLLLPNPKPGISVVFETWSTWLWKMFTWPMACKAAIGIAK